MAEQEKNESETKIKLQAYKMSEEANAYDNYTAGKKRSEETKKCLICKFFIHSVSFIQATSSATALKIKRCI